MYEFLLNGKRVTASSDQSLLAYLRDVAGLKSVKNGCANGTCGACTVLVDGKSVRSCILSLSKVVGKQVETVEGLSQEEKEIYALAFSKAGAVQCGFCTPGMVMSAKALLLKNPSPSRADAKQAIKGNICRCTGYVKIVDAIILASHLLKGEVLVEDEDEKGGVGARRQRLDAKAKILGQAQYCDDIVMDDMLHAAVCRSSHPRARILEIDTSEARQMPGVKAVLTADDIPGSNYDGYVFHDWPTLVPVGDCTRYTGDAVAIVAAETLAQANAAVARIKVNYEVLSPLFDLIEAMQENADLLHENGNILTHVYINRNEPYEKMQDSAHVVTGVYLLPSTDHAFLEPESTIAWFEDDVLNVISGSQNVYSDQAALSRILAMPIDKIRVRSVSVGGGFGGKEDMILQHHAALLAKVCKRPVKLTFTREESILVHPKRHLMKIYLTLGADAEGKFTSLRSRVVADTGAYASLGSGVLRRACTHSCGPYRIPAVEMEGFAVYTNNPPAGAFRGFGVTQSCFALERLIDTLAEKISMDRWEIRRLNALQPGDSMGPGQLCTEDTAIIETLEAVKPYYDEAVEAGKVVGIACALKNTGMGGGKEDISRVRLKVENGKVRHYCSAQCIGQGLDTVMLQIVSEVTGLPGELLDVCDPDTFLTPNANATTASRQTLVSGEATRKAADLLRTALDSHTLDELEGQEFYAEYSAETDKLNDPNLLHPKNHVAYSYGTNLAILGDDKKIEKIVAAFDVGRAINPQLVEGQIEGGVVMGMGYALTEKPPAENGIPVSSYGKLGLLRSTDVPEIEPILVSRNASLETAFGAKGIGEISAIPAVAAIVSAYCDLDGKDRSSLPIDGTPYRK